MNRSLNILFAVFLCSFLSAQTDSVYTGNAQIKKKDNAKKDHKTSDLKEKLFYGGNLNLYYLNGVAVINLNPSVGYKVTEKFHIGAGGVLSMYWMRYGGQSYNTLFYGPHTFARFFVTQGLYLQAQYDKLHQPVIQYPSGALEQGWVDYFLLGGGFRSKVGPKTYIFSSIMFNVNYNPHQISAYYNPLIQFGISSGF